MQIFNSPTRYGAVAQSLHWLVVVLVILAWVLGVSDDLLPKGPAREAGLYIHITAGLLVIVLTFARLLWRTADPSPPAENTEFGDWSFAGWMGLGAKLAHFGLSVRDRFAVARRPRFRARSEGNSRIAVAWAVGIGRPARCGGAGASLGVRRPHADPDAAGIGRWRLSKRLPHSSPVMA